MAHTVEVDLGSYLVVFSKIDPGSAYHFPMSCRDELDAAFHHWIERSFDRVLTLTMCDGDEILMAASSIGDVCVSTPEGRAVARARRDARKAEDGLDL